MRKIVFLNHQSEMDWRALFSPFVYCFKTIPEDRFGGLKVMNA